MGTPPDPDGAAAWAAVAATVRPIGGRKRPIAPAKSAASVPAPLPPPVPRPVAAVPRTGPRDTLDGGWDRRLKRGAVAPDMTVDLHGHTLFGAHDALEAGLARAVASGVRVVLLVAGKPPRGGTRLDSPLRGIIRASVSDWLHHSPHAAAIAAVRPAHPRHGGAGALYLILRRRR